MNTANTAQKIRDIKKGEYIRLKDSETSPVYIRGDYCRVTKKYSLISFDDINREVLKRGDYVAFIGFTF